MTRPATRLREGLRRIAAAWSAYDAACSFDGGGCQDAHDALEAAEDDLGLAYRGSAERLIEALDDERAQTLELAAQLAREAADSMKTRDPAVGGVVEALVADILVRCARARRTA